MKDQYRRPIKDVFPNDPYRFLALKIIEQAFTDAKMLKGADKLSASSGGGLISKYELWNFFLSAWAETLLGEHDAITPKVMIEKAEALLWNT